MIVLSQFKFNERKMTLGHLLIKIEKDYIIQNPGGVI